jgi:hypothetical protein
MNRQSIAASLTLAVVAALGLAGSAAAEELVPFKGTVEGVRVARTPLDPPFVFAQINATGNATQLGQFKVVIAAIANTTTRASIGSFQFVAANGDTLTAEFTGQAMPTAAPNVTAFVEIAIITGGTGRFAGATGGFRVERLLDTDTLVTIGAFEGSISTPGP